MSPGLILIADEEPALRTLFRIWLEARGYAVVTAVDGVHALSIVEEYGLPDAAVVDIHMPRLDGVELCARLKELDRALPTILISVRIDALEAAGAADADAVVDKGAGLGVLCDAVEGLLQARATRTTLRRVGPVAQLVRAGDS